MRHRLVVSALTLSLAVAAQAQAAGLTRGFYNELPRAYKEVIVDTTIPVKYAADPNSVCLDMHPPAARQGVPTAGVTIAACTSFQYGFAFLVLPHPCLDVFQAGNMVACHELMHAYGWPCDHPGGWRPTLPLMLATAPTKCDQ